MSVIAFYFTFATKETTNRTCFLLGGAKKAPFSLICAKHTPRAQARTDSGVRVGEEGGSFIGS
jgi:hypothetical protein